ncbi:CG6241 [Drosophila busckii]|uniref:TATA box-binding protein-associated factor RNA polymerase I subunit B n=1 Tax=Drosophila busckii TaxID=30019 RepID=A0A0M3QYG3_DROBS|nr:TATA box-binding protein-associated factor RNA polymerase I subunit B isoform X2 [Drosophila busckii]ALC47569.1 CG6241 [Drosophila busckii]
MDETDVMEVDNMECDVCGERTFQEREGFYYCIECGTKKEQIRAVEISAEDTFNDTTKHSTQRTIKKPKIKTEENDITSWEFYNYVLRGFLQELLQMGAKPELKLMTLQVWAAYMSRMEVAFCKSNELGLPKLSVRALARDARIIYNHKQSKRKRERSDRKFQQPGDERANWREWRKTKRKLDESGYSGKDGELSESTLHASQSLKLQWSRNARKSLKEHMPLKHLDEHSLDSSGSMLCHKLRPTAGSLTSFDRHIYCLNITKLYVVLAIALNQVEDNIQLCDLLRLIDEDHLTSRNMLGYLPENVAAQGKTLLKQLEFGHQKDKCRYKFIRHHIAQMSRFIDMNGYQQPDLEGLTQRYVLELNLPPQLTSYVKSLMDVLPPKFAPIHGEHIYPRYEARVMAYIIYVLKLLFGLDDVKERQISDSAKTINKQLSQIDAQQPLLFVYTDWMQFVELRKVLVSHYSESFARRFGQSTQLGRKVDDFLIKERKQQEQDFCINDLTPTMQRTRENIAILFETLLKQQFGQSSADSLAKDHIEFQPSLTPAHSYFKRLLLLAGESELSVHIPSCMLVDHTERQLDPFKQPSSLLADYFAQHDISLRVEELACREDIQSVGIFQAISRLPQRHKEYRANCDIKTQTWIEELRRREKRPDFVFREPVANYGRQYQRIIHERAMRREQLERGNPFSEFKATPKYLLQMHNKEVPLDELASIQAFDECNMDPLNVPLELPRRQLEDSTAETVEPKLEYLSGQSEASTSQSQSEELVLKISNFDCWLLHGYLTRMTESDKRKVRTLFPCSFRWLLDTCAATIGVEWTVLYEQLLVIEVMFHHGIEDWSNHKNHLRLKYNIMNKDMNLLTKAFRDMW